MKSIRHGDPSFDAGMQGRVETAPSPCDCAIRLRA